MGRSQGLLLLLSYEMHSLLVAGWEYLCTTSAVDTGMHLRRLSSMPKMDVARISGSKLVSVPNSREMASQAEWSPASDWTACQSGVGEKNALQASRRIAILAALVFHKFQPSAA